MTYLETDTKNQAGNDVNFMMLLTGVEKAVAIKGGEERDRAMLRDIQEQIIDFIARHPVLWVGLREPDVEVLAQFFKNVMHYRNAKKVRQPAWWLQYGDKELQ